MQKVMVTEEGDSLVCLLGTGAALNTLGIPFLCPEDVSMYGVSSTQRFMGLVSGTAGSPNSGPCTIRFSDHPRG